MNVLFAILPTVGIGLAVLIAAAPLGAGGLGYVSFLLPYMVAHVFLVRGKGLIFSPVVFAAGVVVDVISNGPLGFWSLIYLFGVLITRQMSEGLLQTYLGRASALMLVVFALSAAQVGVASLFQLKWVEWHVVLAGTALAGAIAMVLDLMWVEPRSPRGGVGMERVGRRIPHV